MAFKPPNPWDIRDRGKDIAPQVTTIEEFDWAFALYLLGDKLAADANVSFQGIEALHFELVIRHNWLPVVVRELPLRDLKFLFQQELDVLVLTEEQQILRTRGLSMYGSNLLNPG